MTQNTKILTSGAFQEGMDRLEAVLQDKKINEALLKIYYEKLCYCADSRFLSAVNNIIDNEQWFPTIKVFLKYLPEPPIKQPSLKEMTS